MEKTLEEQLEIIPLKEAIDIYQEKYPEDEFHKIQLEYKGPFLRYKIVGTDGIERHNLNINAKNKEVIKEAMKALKEKYKESTYLEKRKLNLKGLKELTEVNRIAKEASPVKIPFEWELDREGERTVWEVELADEEGSNIYEVKVDAQDGTIVQIKLKS